MSPVAAPRATRRSTAPAVPSTPTSLIKVPSAALAVCEACGSSRVTSIAMTLTDGTPVRFTNCRNCEHRTWTGEGAVLPVDAVIAKATKHK